MRFISPKTDFAFKKIFGSPDSKDILISFLNALIYNGESTIEDLEILDPYQIPQVIGLKDTYLDVKAKLKDGSLVIIEMQVLNVESFGKRVLYNASKAYSLQLDAGQGYWALKPVIALTITDFIMFPETEKFINHFAFKELEANFIYPENHLDLIFVELPKFTKTLDNLETLADQWMFFLQQTATLNEVPAPLRDNPNFDLAFHIAETSNLSLEEFELLERRALAVEDSRNVVRRALLEGLEQGLQQGLQQGQAQGEQQRSRDIARSLLGLLPPETIAEKTGLTVAEVEALGTE